mgnify:CR=1 FL=1
MPERKIQFRQGCYYHLYNQGAGRQSIIREEKNYHYLLELINKHLAELQLTLIAYCLMPNHYHWLVRQDSDNAAGLLAQRVFNSYTRAFNNAYSRTGTLFAGRYKAILVSSDEYLRHLCCYIHANPVKDGFALAPELWPYSNYQEWIGMRNGKLVDRALVAQYFPIPGSYQQYVLDYCAHRTKLPKGLQAYIAELEAMA